MQLMRISLLRELGPQAMEDKRNAAEQAECPFGMATNLKDRQSSQESGLDGQARTEGEAHTWSWGLGFTQSVEDEKDRRRGHVAVVGQNLMRDIQGKPIQA
jgi:long-subunit fatty acid transport protein